MSPLSPLTADGRKVLHVAALDLGSSTVDSKVLSINESTLSSDIEKEKIDKDAQNRNRQSQSISSK